MTKYTGKDLAVSIGGSVIAQTYMKSFTLTESRDVPDSTGGGGGPKENIGGERGASWSMELWNSDADADIRDLISLARTTTVAMIVYPKGVTSTETRKSFNAWENAITEGNEKNTVSPMTVGGTVNGAIIRDTVP